MQNQVDIAQTNHKMKNISVSTCSLGTRGCCDDLSVHWTSKLQASIKNKRTAGNDSWNITSMSDYVQNVYFPIDWFSIHTPLVKSYHVNLPHQGFFCPSCSLTTSLFDGPKEPLVHTRDMKLVGVSLCVCKGKHIIMEALLVRGSFQ